MSYGGVEPLGLSNHIFTFHRMKATTALHKDFLTSLLRREKRG
jgi:hypothetical protein